MHPGLAQVMNRRLPRRGLGGAACRLDGAADPAPRERMHDGQHADEYARREIAERRAGRRVARKVRAAPCPPEEAPWDVIASTKMAVPQTIQAAKKQVGMRSSSSSRVGSLSLRILPRPSVGCKPLAAFNIPDGHCRSRTGRWVVAGPPRLSRGEFVRIFQYDQGGKSVFRPGCRQGCSNVAFWLVWDCFICLWRGVALVPQDRRRWPPRERASPKGGRRWSACV